MTRRRARRAMILRSLTAAVTVYLSVIITVGLYVPGGLAAAATGGGLALACYAIGALLWP